MIVEAGKKLFGDAIYIPRDILTESVVGARYEIHIKTERIPDEVKAARALVDGLYEKGVKTTWIRVEDDSIKMQVETDAQVQFFPILILISALLMPLGIIVLLVTVFLLIVKEPWLAILGVAGLVLVAVGYLTSRKATKTFTEGVLKEIS